MSVKRLQSAAGFVLVTCGVAGVVATASSTAMRRLTRAPMVDVRAQQTADRYASATRYLSGRLSGEAASVVDRARDDAGLAIVLVVHKRDVRTCEDLGRQLRELRRAIGPQRSLLAVTDSDAVEDVASFLSVERVASVTVRSARLGDLLRHSAVLLTPAVLLVDRRDSVVQAVSHPSRFPDARVRSFASELTALTSGK